MQLALLADIHGNLEALRAVLADVDRRAPRARVVCAGDIVGYGPDPEICIERLREREALLVMGNHEEMVLGTRDFSRCVHAGIVAAMWTRETLSPSAYGVLSALPSRIEPAPGLFVCHGDLESADTYVSTAERARSALLQLEGVRRDARILICGHTHHAALYAPTRGFIPMTPGAEVRLPRDEACVLNPGAVGQARDETPLARYALLDVDAASVSYVALTYDHRATVKKLRHAGLVPRVVMPPPSRFARRLERLKTAWARRQAAKRTPS